jgi:hypothetical protein
MCSIEATTSTRVELQKAQARKVRASVLLLGMAHPWPFKVDSALPTLLHQWKLADQSIKFKKRLHFHQTKGL